MRPLDHRSRRVLADLESGTPPSGDYTEAMLAWHARSADASADVPEDADIAFAIRASDRQRAVIEALLVSGCPPETVRTAFRVPERATLWYAELFFDTSVFRTELDRLEYLEDCANEWERELKLRAVNLGYEFVLFTYANLVPKTAEQKRLVERMFMATAYKAMTMNYSGIRTEVTRNAVKHAELMLRAYDMLVRTAENDVDEGHDLVALLAVPENAATSGKAPKQEEIV